MLEVDAAEKQTIVRRLINGANGIPPVPVVWGISATVERFNTAMAEAEGCRLPQGTARFLSRLRKEGTIESRMSEDKRSWRWSISAPQVR